MKLILLEHPDHFELCLRNSSGINDLVFTFTTKAEVDAFVTGFNAAKQLCNRLVQSLPLSYTTEKPKPYTEIMG